MKFPYLFHKTDEYTAMKILKEGGLPATLIGLGSDTGSVGSGRSWFHFGCYPVGDPRNEVTGTTVPHRPVQIVWDSRAIFHSDDFVMASNGVILCASKVEPQWIVKIQRLADEKTLTFRGVRSG